MRQDVLDRLVSEERARKVAEILFPNEIPGRACICGRIDPCGICVGFEISREQCWPLRIAQVRRAIQATFPLSKDTPSQGN